MSSRMIRFQSKWTLNRTWNIIKCAKMMKTFDTDRCTLFRPGREPERRHSSYYPNLSQPVSRTPSHGSDYAKFRDAMQIVEVEKSL